MTSDIFAYDAATSSSILSQVSNSSEFLKTPPHELKTRDYEKERRKLVSYDLHCITLAEYHKQGKIPRGLRCNLRPTLFSEDPDYCDKYKRILNKCSLDIIILTIEFLQKAITETKDNIRAIETQLSSTLTSTDWTNLKDKTDKVLADHQKFLEEKKRQKFQRDNDDYSHNKVYKWSDSAGNNPWRRPYQRKTGSFSTESDSSTGSYKPRFLSKGRRGGHQRTDRQEDREKMTTRSQTR
ncbi:uncharacterized protein LOC143790780 [Ranitomeya variabilis]|uniref:uncharacterized protein LOC143769042 n=1 Tax=Ranitomeya variabilis TaxID=490064 RepID=UPI004055DDD0